MSRYYFAFITIILLSQSCMSQIKFDHDIRFNETSRILGPKELKTIMIDTLKNEIVKYELQDNRGKMIFTEYFINGKIKSSGYYIGADELTKKMAVQENPNKPMEYISSEIEYYIPLKDGKWVYFNEQGLITRSEIWEKGKMLSKE